MTLTDIVKDEMQKKRVKEADYVEDPRSTESQAPIIDPDPIELQGDHQKAITASPLRVGYGG